MTLAPDPGPEGWGVWGRKWEGREEEWGAGRREYPSEGLGRKREERKREDQDSAVHAPKACLGNHWESYRAASCWSQWGPEPAWGLRAGCERVGLWGEGYGD